MSTFYIEPGWKVKVLSREEEQVLDKDKWQLRSVWYCSEFGTAFIIETDTGCYIKADSTNKTNRYCQYEDLFNFSHKDQSFPDIVLQLSRRS